MTVHFETEDWSLRTDSRLEFQTSTFCVILDRSPKLMKYEMRVIIIPLA